MSHQSFTTLSEDPSSDHPLSAFLGSNAHQQARTGHSLQQHSPSHLYTQHQLHHQDSRDHTSFTPSEHLHTPKSMDGRGLPDCSPSELSPGHAHQSQPYYHPHQHQDVKYDIRSPPNNRHSAVPPTPTSPQSNQNATRTSSFDYAPRQQRPYEQAQRYQQQPPTPSDLASPGAQSLSRNGMAQAGGSVAASPSYAPNSQYSAYQQHAPHDMYQSQAHMGYGGRPEWPTNQFGQPMYSQMPVSAAAQGMMSQDGHYAAPQGGHLSTVYSFVPIPGAAQHKRPRRRFEEIERMYKCGWQGCEKAYGTLNHLNAHVTMQSHGSKRTPEEFKEIRKEWKAKKKEEENLRKQEEERARQDGGRNDSAQHSVPPTGQPSQQAGGQYGAGGAQPLMASQMGSGGTQLPPIGYNQQSAPTSATSSQPYSAATDGSDNRQYANTAGGQMYSHGGYSYAQYQPRIGI